MVNRSEMSEFGAAWLQGHGLLAASWWDLRRWASPQER